MIDPKASPDDKRRRARTLFVEWSAHWRRYYAEVERAARFYHNTDGEGQWRKEDLEYLRKQGRSALTMNIIHPKIDNVVGMNEDNRQQTRAAPVGGEDQPVADVVNALIERIDDDLDTSAIEAEAFEDGAILGQANINLSVRRDPRNPSHLELAQRVISPCEVKWDPASELPDGSDAKGLFWDRWVSESEFLAEFPDHRDKLKELASAQETGELFGSPSIDRNRLAFVGEEPVERDYSELADSRWYNRKKGEVRVLHFEYRRPVRRYYAVRESGEHVPVSDALGKRLSSDAALRGPLRVVTVWDEEWYWLDFIANETLYDGPSAEPYEGSSLVRYNFFTDSVTGHPYGLLRNLIDPQLEVNKSWSQSHEHVGAQGKPGYIAEKSAFDGLSISKFEEDVKIGGTVAQVADGALTGGKIQDRKLPEFSPAVVTRLQMSLDMADRVSGIHADLDSPAAQAEAAFTVGLREKKALRGMIASLKRFQRVQKALARRKLQVIVEAMPDSQIQETLGNSDRFRVASGTILDQERQIEIPLTSIRALQYDIELQSAHTNQTERLVILQTLLQLQQVGQPVDPEVIFDLLSPTRAMKEKLVSFAKAASESAAESAGRQEEIAVQQLQIAAQTEAQKIQVDASKAQEQQRHNIATEVQAAVDSESESRAKFLSIWEKADEKEKSFITEMARLVAQRQQTRAA